VKQDPNQMRLMNIYLVDARKQVKKVGHSECVHWRPPTVPAMEGQNKATGIRRAVSNWACRNSSVQIIEAHSKVFLLVLLYSLHRYITAKL